MGQIVKPKQPLMDTINHYKDVILGKKWMVLGLFVLMTPLAYIGLQKSGKLNPGDQVSVQMGMHQPLQEKSIWEYRSVYLQKIELLKSRSFLTDVIKQMSLYLQLKDIQRDKVFDTLKVDEFCIKGEYRFVVHEDRNRYSILITNEKLGYKDRTVRSGKLSQLTHVSFPGFFVKFNTQFLEAPFSFEFNLISARAALNNFSNNFKVNEPSSRNPSFSISLKGKDPKLITSTINYLADHFIQQDILLRKQRTDQTLSLLNKQLQTAGERKEQSLRELNAYLSRNPDVALDQRLEQTVNDLNSLESSQEVKSSTQLEANQLLKNYKQVRGNNDRLRVVGEVLDFLRMNQVTTASFLYDEYTRVLQEKQELAITYAPNHPLVRGNMEKYMNIEQKAVDMLSSYIDKLSLERSADRKQINFLANKVNSLPNKYSRLAELRSTHTTHSQTYSSILSRYNEAKVANSVEVADFFVIDYAIQPLPTPEILYYFQLVALSLCIGLVLSIGPVLARENLKTTASSSFDLHKFEKTNLLESLPNIPIFNKKSSRVNADYPRIATPDQSLHSNAYVESMRSLSVKLLTNNTVDKSYALVSLEPGVGKSTVTANLSATMAMRNKKTLLLDGDMRRGVQADIFSLGKKKGLSDILKSNTPLSQELVHEFIQPTKIENLFVMPCGGYEMNSFELMSSERMKQLKKLVASIYEVVILDTPPLGACADAVSVSDCFSSYIPVVLAGKTSVPKLNKKLKEFPQLQKKVAGVLLNRVTLIEEGDYYYHYGYQKKKNKKWSFKPFKGLKDLTRPDSIHQKIKEKTTSFQGDIPRQKKEPSKSSLEKEHYLLLQKKRTVRDDDVEQNLKRAKTEPEPTPVREKVLDHPQNKTKTPIPKFDPPQHNRFAGLEIKSRKRKEIPLPQTKFQTHDLDHQMENQNPEEGNLSDKFKSLLLK